MMESPDRSKWSDDDGPRSAKSGRNGPSVVLIIALVVAAIIVVWFLQNSHDVTISFFWGDWDTTVRWAILIAVLLGVVLDRLVTYAWRRHRRRKTEE